MIAFMSCNGGTSDANTKTGDTTTTDKSSNAANDMDDGIIGDANDKENFVSSCNIDAGTWAGMDAERKKIFCECVFEKSKGKYPAEFITDTMKLKSNEELRSCFEKVQQ